MVVAGLLRWAMGDAAVASTAGFGVEPASLTQVAVVLLLPRAFASGCSAAPGPSSRNASGPA